MSAVHVTIRAGGEHYALPVAGVLEVAEIGDVTPVPGALPVILGIRNLRGQVIPVVDLTALLGVESRHSPQRIVVAEQGGRRVGLAVESVSDVGLVGDPTETVESRYLRGAAFVDGALVGIVDIAATLDAITAVAAT